MGMRPFEHGETREAIESLRQKISKVEWFICLQLVRKNILFEMLTFSLSNDLNANVKVASGFLAAFLRITI